VDRLSRKLVDREKEPRLIADPLIRALHFDVISPFVVKEMNFPRDRNKIKEND
jgi:hypothetical protein